MSDVAKEVNAYTRDIMEKAEANGWLVLEWKVSSPGYVILQDARGSTVTIASEWGLDTPYYVEQFKARPKDTLKIEKR